VPGSIGEVTVN